MTMWKSAMSNHSSTTTSTQSPNGSSSSGNGYSPCATREQLNRPSRAVWAGRILFIATLSAVAAALGVGAYYLLTNAETDLANTQFDSIADRALTAAQAIADRKRDSVAAFARIISRIHANASDWPYVIVPGFEEISRDLLKLSSGGDMGFFPFVTTSQISQFERFAYNYYANSTDPVFSNKTAMSSFGKGIFRLDFTSDAPDFRVRETSGNTTWGSPHDILAPILQYDQADYPFLLFNTHSDETRGRAWDNMIDCANDPSIENKPSKCGVQTDILYSESKENGQIPFAGIAAPIFPANSPTNLTGILGTLITWNELFENVFSDEVNGIDVVLETNKSAHTFTVVNGVVQSVGKGDVHSHVSKRASFRSGKSIVITDANKYTDNSPIYRLLLYPNEELYVVYSTNNPRIAAAGAVLVIVFTSILFFLYDFFVRRDFRAKQELLQAKRRFMRYVSHEVRTPLNSVCMGLDLIQKEIASSLGYDDNQDDSTQQHEMQQLLKRNKDIVPKNKTVPSTDALEWLTLTTDVLDNAQSAVDVLNDLLNYDKIETGTLTLELTLIQVWHLVQKCTDEFKLPASNKCLNLQLCFCEQGGDDCVPSGQCCRHYSDLASDTLQQVVVGDSVRLTQVLRNLVSNALKFTPQGGTVTIRAAHIQNNKSDEKTFSLKNGQDVTLPQSGQLKLVVTDTGAGMSQDQLAKLFRPGVQFDANKLQGGKGSGFGLYIAKGIVEQHNGTLTCTSEGLGKGSTFTMLLPLYHDPDSVLQSIDEVDEEGVFGPDLESGLVTNAVAGEDESSRIQEQQDTEADGELVCTTASIQKPQDAETKEALPIITAAAAAAHPEEEEPSALRILVVDDVASNRKLLCRLLQKKGGHSFDEAVNGQEAVDKVRESMQQGNLYDTILLDYEMPVMNGPTAAKEIRALGSDVFIVAITGNMLPEDVSYFRSCGADAVLPKPFKMNELETLWVEHGLL